MVWSEMSCMLKPSPLRGIGVFATHDIPAGAIVFTSTFEFRTLKVKDVPPALLRFCIYISDEECICPERFDRMEIGWYINHSDTPNIARKSTIPFTEAIKSTQERAIYAICDIKAGDEILIDYNHLDEPEHLKEDFYR